MSLELVAVSRRFGRTQALERVDLCVERGDCYGFIGHNGAGKTTAMRIALGLQRPDEGHVRIDGFDARRHPKEARALTGGLIEVPGFQPTWSGRRNLEALARLQGLSRVGARREAGLQLERVRLAEVAERAVEGYSHGMRQRLGIAQALLGSPAYVLLDEPTNGLDPEGIAEMRALLAELVRAERHGFLISSHQLHELSGLCNRIGVLRRGRLLLEERTEVLLAGAAAEYWLATEAPERAFERLSASGLVPRTTGDGELRFELGGRDAADLARELVLAGVPLRAFAPVPVSLEEIYLRRLAPDAIGAPEPRAEPEPRPARPGDARPSFRAPGGAVRRAASWELARIGAGLGPWLLAAAPAVLAAIAVARRSAEARESAGAVAGAEVFSATAVTAFEATGRGLQAGLPLLAMIAIGVASQSIAAELARGTLRNALLRPLRRVELVIGKAGALLLFVVLAYALLAGASLAAAAVAFDFEDTSELLPNGSRYLLTAASELRPELARALLEPLLPLGALAGLGFLAGSIARSGAGALALALALGVSLDLARTLLRGAGLEAASPNAYLPSLLGDRSYVAFFVERAQGVSNATFDLASTASLVPAAWLLLSFALSARLVARRSVP